MVDSLEVLPVLLSIVQETLRASLGLRGIAGELEACGVASSIDRGGI
jgi:hypothetical protein